MGLKHQSFGEELILGKHKRRHDDGTDVCCEPDVCLEEEERNKEDRPKDKMVSFSSECLMDEKE